MILYFLQNIAFEFRFLRVVFLLRFPDAPLK